MGSHVSRLIDSTPFSEYIVRNINIPPNLLDVNLYIDQTKLLSPFHPTDSKRGLFTANPIPKNSIIKISLMESTMINDGVMDFRPLMEADTSRDVFEAWHMVYNSYHNFDVIAKKVNLVNLKFPEQDPSIVYYEVIQDIPAGGELLTYYGIVSWFLIAVLILSTQANLAGYIKFYEVAIYQCHKDYRTWIQKYIDWIYPHLNPNVPIRYTDPNYLEAYDKYYSTVFHTQSMESELLKTIPQNW
jgi:hypothetical protein